jgi:hypothetical protein
MDKNSRSRSGIRIRNEHPGSYRELRNNFFEVILKSIDADADPGIFLTLDRDPGWENFGSGINIPDPKHCGEVKSCGSATLDGV